MPKWQPFGPPEVKAEVVEGVYRAVLEGRKMKIRYHKRGEKKAETYEANPVGLVFRERFVCLICSLYEYENVVQLVRPPTPRAGHSPEECLENHPQRH